MGNMILITIILFVIVFLVVVFIGITPKGRKGVMNSMMKSNLDVLKDMHTGEMSETLKDLSKTAINIKKDILTENEEVLKEVAEMEANIEKSAIRIKAEAVKEGFSSGGVKTIYCKHCGAKIDNDSKFCKECGKAQ